MERNHYISKEFAKAKDAVLRGIDYSRKGSIDEPIIYLIEKLNTVPQYFSTSSCSGRIIIVGNAPEQRSRKKGCSWCFVSHAIVDYNEVVTSLSDISSGDYALKFEPFIIHVQCANIEAARELLQTGVAAGYRNSGISIGKKGKIITALRSTTNLEVPLIADGRLLASEKYVEYLVDIANIKMKENHEKIGLLIFNHMEMEPPRSLDTQKRKVDKNVSHSQQFDHVNYDIDDELAGMLEDMLSG